jgi:hypothetical protein
MEPLRTSFPAGPSLFPWSAEIPRYYGIAIHQLLPLAKAAGNNGERIVPIVLFYEQPKNRELIYRFGFVPQQAVTVLNYKIYPAGSTAPIYSATLRDLEAEQRAEVRWQGRDQNNKPARNGPYVLWLEATFRALPGEQGRKVTTTYEFYHHADILRSKWVVRK